MDAYIYIFGERPTWAVWPISIRVPSKLNRVPAFRGDHIRISLDPINLRRRRWQATTAGDDRLSALGNDLLRRILYFVPFKEATSTSVLSRRWDSLWRSSGAVNLDVRMPDEDRNNPGYSQRKEDLFSHRDAFVRAAHAVLDTTAARVTRLTLRVEDLKGRDTDTFLSRNRVWRRDDKLIGGLLSHRVAHHM
jgi:hypothetical protein